MPKNIVLLFLFLPFLILTACSQGNRLADEQSTQSGKTKINFSGCYSIEKGSPAQILIKSDTATPTMQMKEPNGGWDTPESMRMLDGKESWEFYKVNALELNKEDILATIGREDGVMVVSALKPAVASVNPHIDSGFVVSLFGAVNTIYQVECDDVGLTLAPKDGIHQLPNTDKSPTAKTNQSKGDN